MEDYDAFYAIFVEIIDKYGDTYRSDVNTSLLNVILVVKKARPSCIIDRLRWNDSLLQDFLEIIKLYYENLSIIQLPSVEYLVCLTKNVKKILRDYKINPGKALGYCYLFKKSDYEYYTEEYKNNPKYAIYYYAISNISQAKIELFITVVPINKYDSIKQCIIDQVESFNNVLSNLDYNVTYEIKNKI